MKSFCFLYFCFSIWITSPYSIRFRTAWMIFSALSFPCSRFQPLAQMYFVFGHFVNQLDTLGKLNRLMKGRKKDQVWQSAADHSPEDQIAQHRQVDSGAHRIANSAANRYDKGVSEQRPQIFFHLRLIKQNREEVMQQPRHAHKKSRQNC